MSDLSKLIARVEAASGPDWEIDEALMLIGEYVRDKRHIGATENSFIEMGDEEFYPVKDDVWVDTKTDKWVSTQALNFTTSMEAALALFERKLPGWDYGLDRDEGDFFATIYPQGALISSGYQGTGASIALAVLSALLRALQSQERGS